MDVALPLDQMTTEEKLRALEQIWADLCRTPSEVGFPAWHAELLRDRERRVREGSSQFVEWSAAKKRIRESAE